MTTSALTSNLQAETGAQSRTCPLERLTPVSGSGDPLRMPDAPPVPASLPPTMPAAVFMGLRDVRVEDRPLPPMTPTDVLVEVSHCGICGSDLHFLLEWGGKSGVIEGHEYSGTIVAVGCRGDRLERGGAGDRGPVGPVRHVRVLPRGPAVALREPGPGRRRRRRLAGCVRAVQDHPVGAAAAHPGAPRGQARRADRTDGGRTARHHPRRRRATRHALAGDGRRPDRLPVGRRVARRSASTTSW